MIRTQGICPQVIGRSKNTHGLNIACTLDTCYCVVQAVQHTCVCDDRSRVYYTPVNRWVTFQPSWLFFPLMVHPLHTARPARHSAECCLLLCQVVEVAGIEQLQPFHHITEGEGFSCAGHHCFQPLQCYLREIIQQIDFLSLKKVITHQQYQ